MCNLVDQILGDRHREALIEDIKSLLDWLEITSDPDDELLWRFAPSPVVRSDAEILGASSPRFSSRFIFHSDGSSFINFRRKDELREALLGRSPVGRNTSKHRTDIRFTELAPSNEYFLIEKVRLGSHIADCILDIPHRYSTGFQFVRPTEALGRSYGERDSPTALPYVEMLDLSGACTQSVLFLTAVILKKFVSGIHGIAEISANCCDMGCDEFLLDDIFDEQIGDYCEKINLRYLKQSPMLLDREVDIRKFSALLSAYLASDIPVSVPVDIGRMLGFSNYEIDQTDDLISNTYQEIPGYDSMTVDLNEDDAANHVILLVGFEKNSDLADRRFIFHDPAVRPYIEITASQLFLKGCIGKVGGKPQLMPAHFGAFVPKIVKVALSGYRSKDDESWGLLDYLEDFFDYQAQYGLKVPGNECVYESEFRLTQLDSVLIQIRSVLAENEWEFDATNFQMMEAELSICLTNPHIGSKWCWLQMTEDALWIWDAEIDLDMSPRAVSRFFDSCNLYYFSFREKPDFLRSTFSIFDHDLVSSPKPSLRSVNTGIEAFAMGSSLSIDGLAHSLKGFPADCEYVDLYAFMQGDLRRDSPIFDGVEIKSGSFRAIDILPTLLEDSSVITRISHNIMQILDGNLRVGSISSFFPEITSYDPKVRKQACYCLEFLRRLADKISCDQSETIRAIEIVAGSRITSLWQAEIAGRGKKSFTVASLANWNQQKTWLLDELRDLVSRTEDLGVKVPIGIEVEPGPLFFLNGSFEVESLCSAIASDSILKSQVGLNLDLPHWVLAGIRLNSIQKDVRDRIVHLHLCDHDQKGHFGDVLYGELPNLSCARDPDERLFLISLVKEADTRDLKSTVPFSGLATLECESGYIDQKRISTSWSKLRSMQ